MAQEMIRVRPSRSGLRVIDPRTGQPLPEEGAYVPAAAYWTKRLQQGDVVRVAEDQSASASAPAPDEPADDSTSHRATKKRSS